MVGSLRLRASKKVLQRVLKGGGQIVINCLILNHYSLILKILRNNSEIKPKTDILEKRTQNMLYANDFP